MKKFLRAALYFWTLFIGLGAVAGTCGMLYDTSGVFMGMDKLLPYFQVLPFADVVFQDYTFSAFALLCVNGLTQLVTFVLLLKKSRLATRFAAFCGMILMAWICIQFVIFPMNALSTSYFIFGLVEAICGFAAYRTEKKNG